MPRATGITIWDKIEDVGDGVFRYYWEQISEYQIYDRNDSCYDFAHSQLQKYGR